MVRALAFSLSPVPTIFGDRRRYTGSGYTAFE